MWGHRCGLDMTATTAMPEAVLTGFARNLQQSQGGVESLQGKSACRLTCYAVKEVTAEWCNQRQSAVVNATILPFRHWRNTKRYNRRLLKMHGLHCHTSAICQSSAKRVHTHIGSLTNVLHDKLLKWHDIRCTYWGSRVALCSSGTAAMTSTSFGDLARQYLREACKQTLWPSASALTVL